VARLGFLVRFAKNLKKKSMMLPNNNNSLIKNEQALSSSFGTHSVARLGFGLLGGSSKKGMLPINCKNNAVMIDTK
jgi:hypothetical protein